MVSSEDNWSSQHSKGFAEQLVPFKLMVAAYLTANFQRCIHQSSPESRGSWKTFLLHCGKGSSKPIMVIIFFLCLHIIKLQVQKRHEGVEVTIMWLRKALALGHSTDSLIFNEFCALTYSAVFWMEQPKQRPGEKKTQMKRAYFCFFSANSGFQ